MQKRRRRLFSFTSPSILLLIVPISLLQGEDKLSSSKHGKGSTKHMHQARAYSTKPHDLMVESKGREAIVPKHPKTQDVKQMSSKGKHYKGKYRLSLDMISQYLKESKCFRCGGCTHVSRNVSQRNKRTTLTKLLVQEDTFKWFKFPYSGSLFST